MAIYKVPDDILIEFKKLLKIQLREYEDVMDIAKEYNIKLKKQDITNHNKYKKLIKLLEDNYGI
jgi:hypothetical protein